MMPTTVQQVIDELWTMSDGMPGVTKAMIEDKVNINMALCNDDVDATYAKMLPEYRGIQPMKRRLQEGLGNS